MELLEEETQHRNQTALLSLSLSLSGYFNLPIGFEIPTLRPLNANAQFI